MYIVSGICCYRFRRKKNLISLWKICAFIDVDIENGKDWKGFFRNKEKYKQQNQQQNALKRQHTHFFSFKKQIQQADKMNEETQIIIRHKQQILCSFCSVEK